MAGFSPCPQRHKGQEAPRVSSESTNPIRWARCLGGTFLHVNSRHKLRPQHPPSHLHEARFWTPLFTLSPLVWTPRVGKSILTSQPGLEVPHHTAWPHAQDPLGPRAAEETVQPPPHTHLMSPRRGSPDAGEVWSLEWPPVPPSPSSCPHRWADSWGRWMVRSLPSCSAWGCSASKWGRRPPPLTQNTYRGGGIGC